MAPESVSYVRFHFGESKIQDLKEIKELAEEIEGKCVSFQCKKRWVKYETLKYEYDDDDGFFEENFLVGKGPEKFMENGGDCQSHSVFMADLFLNMGYDVYFVSQYNETAGHMCVMVKHEGKESFVNCFKDLEYKAIRKVER